MTTIVCAAIGSVALFVAIGLITRAAARRRLAWLTGQCIVITEGELATRLGSASRIVIVDFGAGQEWWVLEGELNLDATKQKLENAVVVHPRATGLAESIANSLGTPIERIWIQR